MLSRRDPFQNGWTRCTPVCRVQRRLVRARCLLDPMKWSRWRSPSAPCRASITMDWSDGDPF